jgi:hypothetical protein
MYVQEKEIGNCEGLTNGKLVKELLLIRQRDVIAVMDPVNFPNFFRNLPTSLTFGAGTIFQPSDTISLRDKTLEGYTIPKGGITVQLDAEICRMKFAANTCTFTESDGETDNGLFYSPSISFELARHNPAASRWLFDNRHERFVSLFKDANGFCFVCGNVDTALMLNVQKAIAGKNFQSIQLTAELAAPTWHLETIVLNNLFESTEFSIEFDFEFNS